MLHLKPLNQLQIKYSGEPAAEISCPKLVIPTSQPYTPGRETDKHFEGPYNVKTWIDRTGRVPKKLLGLFNPEPLSQLNP